MHLDFSDSLKSYFGFWQQAGKAAPSRGLPPSLPTLSFAPDHKWSCMPECGHPNLHIQVPSTHSCPHTPESPDTCPWPSFRLCHGLCAAGQTWERGPSKIWKRLRASGWRTLGTQRGGACRLRWAYLLGPADTAPEEATVGPSRALG